MRPVHVASSLDTRIAVLFCGEEMFVFLKCSAVEFRRFLPGAFKGIGIFLRFMTVV